MLPLLLILGATATNQPGQHHAELDISFHATITPALELVEQDGHVTVIAHHSPLGDAGWSGYGWLAGGGRWVEPKLLAGVP